MTPTDPLPQQIAALRQRVETARRPADAGDACPGEDIVDELVSALDGLHAAAVAQAEAGRHATAALEDRVCERTAQLSLANEQLEYQIAEGKQTLAALRDSEARFRAAAEGSPDAVYILRSERDADGNIVDFTCTYLNSNAERQLGTTQEQSLGRRLLEARPESGGPGGFFDMAVRVVQTREALQADFPVTTPDIAASFLHLTLVPLADGVAVTVRDVSERTRLEAQVRQTQKMAAVGQLAGGVAHHFNNLLTVVTGYCDLLRTALSPGDPARSFVNEIHEAGRRAAALTQQLLAFSRKQVLQPVVLDVNEVVRRIERMLRGILPKHTTVRTDLQRDLAPVHVDPDQLEQVLLNLAFNARDAMPQGGTLTLATTAVTESAATTLPPYLPPGGYVRLLVSDTGCGMDAETQGRVFEPFFTTKEVGQGTGLGLATVYGIVRASGGGIDVQSVVGRGTTFTIDLPVVADPPPAPAGLPGGTETVLVVEDEEGVRGLARRVLGRCGYTVLEARDGDEALLQSATHAGPIDLVVADVVMPGMSGPELVRRLRPQRPSTRALFMSGYSGPAGLTCEALDRRALLLEKPFTPTTLARRVREALDSPGGSTS